MNMFFRSKRRLKQEIKGIKYLMSGRKTKKIITATYVAYQITKIVYNPFYLICIANNVIKGVVEL